jgi:hypothetical protein
VLLLLLLSVLQERPQGYLHAADLGCVLTCQRQRRKKKPAPNAKTYYDRKLTQQRGRRHNEKPVPAPEYPSGKYESVAHAEKAKSELAILSPLSAVLKRVL